MEENQKVECLTKACIENFAEAKWSLFYALRFDEMREYDFQTRWFTKAQVRDLVNVMLTINRILDEHKEDPELKKALRNELEFREGLLASE